MKPMLNCRRREGFALPTIILVSVIMLIVLVAAVTAVGSITTSLAGQYYNQLAREAAESGLASASACLRATNYSPTWTDASPLKPNTGCAGENAPTVSPWVVSTGNVRTSFTVGLPEIGALGSIRVTAVGKVELVRGSNAQVWRTYTYTAAENSRYSDSPQIAGGAGWKDWGHNGYMLASTGVLYGWGDNSMSQLGDSSLGITISTPIKVVLPTGVSLAKKVYSSGQGASILCILATHSSLGDQIYCRGQGGLGGTTWQRFGLGAGLTALDMVLTGYGADGACVKASDLQAYCAGLNDSGNLGAGGTSSSFVDMSSPTRFRLDLANPGPVSGSASSLTVQKVFMQDRYTCVIASDNQAYCAGDNNFGQLGQGNFSTNTWVGKSIPGRALIPGNIAVTDVVLTYHASREGVFYQAITGEIFMSGHNGEGTSNDGEVGDSLGDGINCPAGGGVNCYNIPRSISPSAASTSSSPQGFGKIISIGERGDPEHAVCMVYTNPIGDSGLWCLGSNYYGELGTALVCGNTYGEYHGASALGGETATSLMNLEATYQMNSTAVITTLGNVYAAGDNTYGKLGRGSALTSCNNTFAKVQLPAGVKATALANGDEYTMFILGDNGRVYSMGRNNNGQLGDGTTTDRSTPVEVKLPRQELVY